MKAIHRQATATILFFSLLLFTACCKEPAAPVAKKGSDIPPPSGVQFEAEASLVDVIDGDTIDVTFIGEPKDAELKCATCRERQGKDHTRKVRGNTFVRPTGGVDAPEFSEDPKAAEAAKKFLRGLVENAKILYLDVDDGARCKDHDHRFRDAYCRVLATVYVRDGNSWVNVNAKLSEYVKRTTPAVEGIISWQEASKYVGRRCTVQGPVVDARFADTSTGKPTFLNVGKKYPDKERFQVVIWDKARAMFPKPPEDLFRGKKIRVTGKIELSKDGATQIVVNEPGAINIVEE